METAFGPAYASVEDTSFSVRYRASCHCKAIQMEVCADPVDSKICHCRACQSLHGAPMQWAAIFHKHDVRITKGVDSLIFYSSEQNIQARMLPCKVSCGRCGTPIADEGRRMWLTFPSLFDFGFPPEVPHAFRPTCHIFYGSRLIAINDDLPKWSGHKDHSELIF